jgi:hypothetical protein
MKAFFTGHRNIDDIKDPINQLIDIALKRGVTEFFNGMALGTDQLATKFILTLSLPDSAEFWEAMENKSCFNWIVKNDFADADFWLINKGSLKDLGKPVREFQHYYTGIQCPVLIWPDYGYYLCVYFHLKQYPILFVFYSNMILI